VEGRKKIRDGRGEKMLNEPLSDRSNVQSYHIPCEPALMGLTAGSPLSLWAA